MMKYRHLVPLLLLLGLVTLFRQQEQVVENLAPGGSPGLERNNGTHPGRSTADLLPSKSRERGPRSKFRTTPSGLRFEVLREGSGDPPDADDRVAVRYEGRFADGRVFDSTDGRDPMEFALPQVIAGWREGLQLMSPGARYRFIIPPELAYGETGADGMIPPNATLTFEIELVGVTRLVTITDGRIEMPVFSTRRIQIGTPLEDLPACP